MNQSLTICDFLEQTGAKARFFDMGRRVVEIPTTTLRAFEHTEQPYPQPFQRNAWLGILFHHDTPQSEPAEHHIWFVKLPLDEQGLLQQAARDDFLRRIAETLTSDDKTAQQQELDDNPHGFTPREDRMAVFHAKVAQQLGDPPSQYFAHAVDYFCGKPGFEQWNFVGLQGIADVAVRRAETHQGQTLQQTLITAIPKLPDTPFTALCTCLENEAIDAALSQALIERLDSALIKNNAVVIAAIVRGLSHSEDTETLIKAIQSMLDHAIGRDVEVLAAIAGRAWETLHKPALRARFLENLAQCPAGQQAFNGIMTDLLFMPDLRKDLLQDFRNPDCSEKLIQTIGEFLQSRQATTENGAKK